MKDSAHLIKIITIIILLIGLFFTYCKEKQNENAGQVFERDLIKTEIIRRGKFQFAFDFMPIPEHFKMMKKMGIKMNHEAGITHAIELTIINKKSSEIVKNAKVSFKIKNPDNQIIQRKTMIMSGAGMHHYMTDWSAEKEGLYIIDCTIRANKIKNKVKLSYYIEK
jgi:hypothetical protein